MRGLVSRFGAQVVHDGLDIDVPPNEIFGVVGGSGTGKSVLLRTILGLRAPDGGTVELYGRDVQQLLAAERSALVRSYGVTFQSGALISSLTVAQNIQLPLREYYAAVRADLRRARGAEFGLVGLRRRMRPESIPSQLSGGMVKRAALARAFSLEPKLLFLDEPTPGLDPISAAAFDELLLYLHSATAPHRSHDHPRPRYPVSNLRPRRRDRRRPHDHRHACRDCCRTRIPGYASIFTGRGRAPRRKWTAHG